MDNLLDKLLSHQGRDYVLIPDEIGHEPPSDDSILVAKETSEHESIWVREPAVGKAREMHPKASVHGFWQTLLEAGIVDLGQALSVYYTGDRAGLYLVSEDGFVSKAGRFSGGRLPFELSATYALDTAAHVAVTADMIAPPASSAKLPSEIISDRYKAHRSAMLTGALVGALIVIAAGAYAWQRDHSSQIRAATMHSIKEQQVVLQSKISDLKKNHHSRKVSTFPQQQTAANLLDLVSHSRQIVLDKGLMASGEFVARVSGLTINPEWASTIVPLANGDYAVTYGAASVSEVPNAISQ